VAGAPEWKEGIRLRGSRAVELGQLDTVGDGVRRLTGRDAAPIDGYVRANADLFTADAAP
jgi:hypothetical protein